MTKKKNSNKYGNNSKYYNGVKIYRNIDLVNEIILREIFSFMERSMSVRILLYSFSTVTEFWWFGILNCILPLTNNMHKWAADIFIHIRLFKQMIADIVKNVEYLSMLFHNYSWALGTGAALRCILWSSAPQLCILIHCGFLLAKRSFLNFFDVRWGLCIICIY